MHLRIPGDVGRDQALHLLTQRAVLTRTVCRELLDSGGGFNDRRPRTAIALLSRWVKATFPETEPLGLAVRYGLDNMVVPAGCEDVLREISDGAEVCEALVLLVYGDTCDVESDKEAIAKALDAYWKAHAQIVQSARPLVVTVVDLPSRRANGPDRIT